MERPIQVWLTERDFQALDESYLEALVPSCDVTPGGKVFCNISVESLMSEATTKVR